MKVFITGITGTLGKALVRRFYGKWNIVGYSRDELKQAQMKVDYPDIDYQIGDVRDADTLRKLIKGVDAVLHTAAMKRIEVCEKNPMEAVKTNIVGTENIAAAAYHHDIAKVLTVGSDKGVEPVNAYGMTKAMQEKIFVSFGYNCVRYGNVFGSRGSVAPLFFNQVKKGEPLSVTDPQMTRFILTIDEAVDLILLALDSSMRGDIFIKKSPAARLIDIAHSFSQNIKVIGKGRGEKLHETLVSAEETTRLVEAQGYFVIQKDAVRKDYGKPYSSDQERMLGVEEIKELARACGIYDAG